MHIAHGRLRVIRSDLVPYDGVYGSRGMARSCLSGVCISHGTARPFIEVGTFPPDVSTNRLPLQRTRVLLKPQVCGNGTVTPPPCRLQHTCGLEYSTSDMAATAQDKQAEAQNGSAPAVKSAPGASWKQDETHVLPHNRLSVVRQPICVR